MECSAVQQRSKWDSIYFHVGSSLEISLTVRVMGVQWMFLILDLKIWSVRRVVEGLIDSMRSDTALPGPFLLIEKWNHFGKHGVF